MKKHLLLLLFFAFLLLAAGRKSDFAVVKDFSFFHGEGFNLKDTKTTINNPFLPYLSDSFDFSKKSYPFYINESLINLFTPPLNIPGLCFAGGYRNDVFEMLGHTIKIKAP